MNEQSEVIRINDIKLSNLSTNDVIRLLKSTERNIGLMTGKNLELEMNDKELLLIELERRENERLLQRTNRIRTNRK